MARNSRISARDSSVRKLTKAQELRADSHTGPIYRELGHLTALTEPLDPAHLEDCNAICQCNAVTQYLSGDESPAEIAAHAVQAIELAVSAISIDRDRQIAEAEMGMGAFRGHSNRERRRILKGHPYYVTRDPFNKRRPYALGATIHGLDRPPAVPALRPRTEVTLPANPAERALIFLAYGASSLYRSLLASLLIARTETSGIRFHTDQGDPPFPIIEVGIETLRAFGAFLSTPYYAHMHLYKDYERLHDDFSIISALRDVFEHDSIIELVGNGTGRSLLSAYVRTIDASPFTEDECDLLCLDLRQTMGYGVEVDAILNRKHLKWQRWLATQLFSSASTEGAGADPHRRFALDGMISAVGMLLRGYRHAVSIQEISESEVQSATLKYVVRVCGIDLTNDNDPPRDILSDMRKHYEEVTSALAD